MFSGNSLCGKLSELTEKRTSPRAEPPVDSLRPPAPCRRPGRRHNPDKHSQFSRYCHRRQRGMLGAASTAAALSQRAPAADGWANVPMSRDRAGNDEVVAVLAAAAPEQRDGSVATSTVKLVVHRACARQHPSRETWA